MPLTSRPITLVDCALVISILLGLVMMFCAVAITADIHQARIEFTVGNNEWRREALRRVDQGLWKADTALETFAAMRLDLGNMITKLRAQVKQSSDASTKAATVQTQAATVAVTKALDSTREAIQAVTGEVPDKPIVSPDPDNKPITVNVPAPVVVSAAQSTETPKVELTDVKKKRRHWISYLWRWW